MKPGGVLPRSANKADLQRFFLSTMKKWFSPEKKQGSNIRPAKQLHWYSTATAFNRESELYYRFVDYMIENNS